MEHIFNETAMQARTLASNRRTKAIKASHGPRVSPQITGKGKGKENNGKSKWKSKVTQGTTQVSKGSGNGTTLKTGISSLENLESETSSENQESVQMGQVCITETSLIHKEWSLDERHDDWSLDEWNDDWSCVGWHEDYERMCSTSVSSFSLESSERVNANLDTGVTVDTFLANFDRKGVGDGRFYDWITDVEARQFQGYDENGKPRSLNGSLADAHQVLSRLRTKTNKTSMWNTMVTT